MSAEQNNAESGQPETDRLDGDADIVAGRGAGGQRQTPTAGAAIRQLRGGSDVAEVQMSEAVVIDALAVRKQQLENEDRHSEREHGDRKHSRVVWATLAILAILGLIALTIALPLIGQGDLLVEIYKGIAIFAGGFGGGYGFSAFRRRG